MNGMDVLVAIGLAVATACLIEFTKKRRRAKRNVTFSKSNITFEVRAKYERIPE